MLAATDPYRLVQLSDRRKRPGVSPVTRRKLSVKRLWPENPPSRAISAIERCLRELTMT
jgi:hypothetical protein